MSLTSYRAAPPRVSRVTSIRGGLDRRKGESWECGPGGDLLFRTLRCSTIGAEGFHGRVRDGIGCLAPRYGHQAGKLLSCEWGGSVLEGRVRVGSCRCTRTVLCWGFKRQSSD